MLSASLKNLLLSPNTMLLAQSAGPVTSCWTAKEAPTQLLNKGQYHKDGSEHNTYWIWENTKRSLNCSTTDHYSGFRDSTINEYLPVAASKQ